MSLDEAYAISTSTDLASNDSEPEPRRSTSAIVEDTVLVLKSKHVSVRAKSDILLQVADTARISNKGMSKSNVHRLGTKVVKETAAMVREKIKSMRESKMVLHFDGKIVKEYDKGRKLKREHIAVSINADGENMLLGIPICANSSGECETETILELLE